MHVVDISIFLLYFTALLMVGLFYLYTNRSQSDYYAGGRNMSAGHIGLSVVATDVGGGFSIGLGGLGFSMGLSGSWMLLTGLFGAWLSAVLLIPKVYGVARENHWLSFPQAMEHYYAPSVALAAGLISLIGYLGFSASQILAGAKLATATFPEVLSLDLAVWVMGGVAIIYTVFGGIRAVIYTDTVQWIILLTGLLFIGLPLGYHFVGGWAAIKATVSPSMLSLSSVTWSQLINWAVTIIPIWFIGMTLYQRIYAAKSEKAAKRAWYIAGVFEWPIMAFMGVLLGLFARVAFEQGLFASAGYPLGAALDEEMGLPVLLRVMLPVGLTGLMLSAYFSAIMSTADSCLLAASGNAITDILARISKPLANKMWVAQGITLALGAAAITLALKMENVLELMLHSYAFMVSALFVPVLAMLLLEKPSTTAALLTMAVGGSTTLVFTYLTATEQLAIPYNLAPVVLGITASIPVFTIAQNVLKQKRKSHEI